jgi:hypothetical protein
VNVAKFQVVKDGAVQFSEDLLTVADNVSLRASQSSLEIHQLDATMQSSKALALSLNGTVTGYSTDRNLDIKAKLNYDLAKLWTIVHPLMIEKGKDDPYKDLQLTGIFEKSLVLSGKYPDQPMKQAIRFLIADASLSVALFDWNGLNIQNLEVPITLKGGQALTVYSNRPEGQNVAPPATANGGQLDLGPVTLDLTQDPPLLSLQAGRQILKGATVNPLFARTWLKNFINNPVFVGANSASGTVDVTVVECDRLPLGELVMKENDPNNTGHATFKFSINNLHIGGQGIGSILSVLFHSNANDSFAANVKDGTISIAKGVATQHIVFQSGSYNLGFDGGVGLESKELKPLTVSIPLAKVVQAIHNDPNLVRYVPDQASVVMTGTLNAPHFQIDKMVSQAIADAAVKALLGGSPSAQTPPNNAGGTNGNNTQPPPDNNDPLGNLLNSLGKKKKNK